MIILKNITLRRGGKVLLQDANATLSPGEKVALIGRNGAGKSSLFAMLLGHLHEDLGELSWPRHWRTAQVAQHMPETEESATDFVLAGDTRLAELYSQLQAAEASDDGLAMAQLHADLADAGAHDARARAQALILGLGFLAQQLEHPVNSFSGGWRMRLQLARALMCPSDVLLLDEPTNHLDLDALVWLEAWLRRYAGTLIVISHDREFLDAVTGTTLHIDQGRLTRYGGNYSTFETLRAQQLALQQAAYERQQEKRAHLQKFIDRFKAKATKARQAQSRIKALERMEHIAPVLADSEFQFEFLEPPQLPNPMLKIRDASLGYGSAGQAPAEGAAEFSSESSTENAAETTAQTVILRGVTCQVQAGQRIGILGANGQGKSTFVKTVAGQLPVLSGRIIEGKGLKVGYFAQQELDVLRMDESPLQHMIRLARESGAEGTDAGREQSLRNYLGRFVFNGDMVHQAIGTLSGGEKARLVLAMLVWQRPNLLLLDEPTNHLDLVTRQALSVALNEFEGTVLLVSHDRALLRAVCDEFWLVAQGQVAPFEGDLDEYQQYLLDQAKARREQAAAAASLASSASAVSSASASGPATAAQTGLADSAGFAVSSASTERPSSGSAPAPSTRNSAEQRRLEAQKRQQLAETTRPWRKALEKNEARMVELTQLKETLEARLSTPLAASDIAEAGRALKACNDELQALEEEWLGLSEQIEKAGA